MKSNFQRFIKKNPNSRHSSGRRRGVAFVYLGLSMVVLLGITGLVVDIGHLHMKEAQAMRAADAAALAGAMQLPDEVAALTAARSYAEMNRYSNGQNGAVVTGTVDSADSSNYTVYVSKPEPLFFISIFNMVNPGFGTQRTVGASATARYTTPANVDIGIGGGDYGVNDPRVNLSVFGPYAEYQHGDPYSPIYYQDGSLNAEHLEHDGYNFKLMVPADYVARNNNKSIVDVEIFDPDTYNKPGFTADGDNAVDEIRLPIYSRPLQPTSIYTATRYRLYKVGSNGESDQLVGDVTYQNDATTDMKWVKPDGFSFDVNTLGTGEYRVNVESIDGSSENGFNLRAGPPRDTDNNVQQPFNSDNGTSVTATGRIPINFNKGGPVTVELGQVPAAARGGSLTIEKFDTDVGSQSVVYTSDPPASNQPSGGWPGQLAPNGEWRKDNPIPLPADYTGGRWSARYEAGQQDTSLWRMSYDSPASGTPGNVRLIGRNGKHY